MLAGCELEPRAGKGEVASGSARVGSSLPPARRFEKREHHLGSNVCASSTPDRSRGAAAGSSYAEIARHPAFLPRVNQADADACLEGKERGTFLLRPAVADPLEGVENESVVLSVATGPAYGVRHLVLRIGGGEGEGISCGLVGPEASLRKMIDRIRKLVFGGVSPADGGGPAPGKARRETPNASLLEGLSR